jgi:hypothetical protein
VASHLFHHGLGLGLIDGCCPNRGH